ncbi:ATP-binding protein [Actinocorallia sp. API 0066]|uniref:ATP-binding protein n=1 Tax=Actinocorallia sp. API 0066 TaxID=2896846 RepID=UPI001E471FC5|nr:ATP-binding protein [Actinocorallia sp. API 0066]MCD0450788.1 ATP-binding protein [Actinocorallia sp. API 0066]
MTFYEDDAMREWHEERRRHRLEIFCRQRPANLRDAGDLHPDVAAWGRRLLDGDAANLVLAGQVGTGKTWSAFEVLERAISDGYPGRVMVVSGSRWRTAIAPPTDRSALAAMTAADILLLDDLGAGRGNEWERELLLGVADERWAHRRPTITTTNTPDLTAAFGERIVSRLADRATVVILNGQDRRAR